MISNEERRKVARRLRELDHVVTNRDTIESGVNKFIKAVYGDRPYSTIECSTRNLCGLAMTLANLIDRPTCKNIACPYDGSFFECSKCGERCELTCGSPADNNLGFCPRCGAEVVS